MGDAKCAVRIRSNEPIAATSRTHARTCSGSGLGVKAKD